MASEAKNKPAAKRRPKQKDAPLGDQDARRELEPSREEKKIIADQGDPARRPDGPGTEAVEATPEQERGDELQAKRDKLGVGHVTQPPVHNRLEIARDFDGVDGGTLTVSTAQGVATFRADRNIRLDKDGVHNLSVFLERVRQAVN